MSEHEEARRTGLDAWENDGALAVTGDVRKEGGGREMMSSILEVFEMSVGHLRIICIEMIVEPLQTGYQVR